jgi:hypothetical protein
MVDENTAYQRETDVQLAKIHAASTVRIAELAKEAQVEVANIHSIATVEAAQIAAAAKVATV